MSSPYLSWALTGLAAIAGWGLLDARPSLVLGAPACGLRQILHIGCPTCGFTRALVDLARGDFGASFVHHPLALPVVGQLAVAWLLWGIGLGRRTTIVRARWVTRGIGANAAAALVIWIVRLALGTIPT